MKAGTSLLNVINNGIVNPETGEVVNIRYLPGRPLNVRFNASQGTFNVNGRKTITEKGKPFSFIPLAVRIFRDDILSQGLKKWTEFFFVNQQDTVCSLLFHGYSVDNLMSVIQDMYYDNVSLCGVELTATPVERTNKATNSKYYIAAFDYKTITEKQMREMQKKVTNIPLWRIDTFTGDAETEIAINYHPPVVLEGLKKAA